MKQFIKSELLKADLIVIDRELNKSGISGIASMLLLKQALISILKVVKEAHLVKRNQALLGSNLAMDNQMQIALNNAAEVEDSGLSPRDNNAGA